MSVGGSFEALSECTIRQLKQYLSHSRKRQIRNECLIDGYLKGFGQFHLRTQGRLRGTIDNSLLFRNRAPPGKVLLLNGATNTGILSKSEGELVEAVAMMLIKPNSTDLVVLEAIVWPQAIPQFLIGNI